MPFRIICPFALLLAVVACDSASTDNQVSPPVVMVQGDDAAMVAAITRARETFWFFEENWQSMESDGYNVKFGLPNSSGELEHIWFTPTSIDENSVTGECANDPRDIPGLAYGDTRTVTRDEISDWMIVVGEKCYGGYTIRVLVDREGSGVPDLQFVDPPTNQ